MQGNYAYRDMLTDVVIETLGGSHRARIKCRDCVRKIAVFEALVAVQLLESIIVYERVPADGGGTAYHLKARISYSKNCDLLVVSSGHLTICDKNKLRCFNFDGVQCVSWRSIPLGRTCCCDEVLTFPASKMARVCFI